MPATFEAEVLRQLAAIAATQTQLSAHQHELSSALDHSEDVIDDTLARQDKALRQIAADLVEIKAALARLQASVDARPV
jgi:hypothetical protein